MQLQPFTTSVKLIWGTPDAEQLLGYIARVSNPGNQDNPNVKGLIRYMIEHKHWSPFEMVNFCFEITTTRDIARQLLRHRSFSFQEFSQRYAEVTEEPVLRDARMQDSKNRQNSISVEWNSDEATEFTALQKQVAQVCFDNYKAALKMGIAKEQARAMLPEGMTKSKLYVNGNLRSWLHYAGVRLDPSTQAEHRYIPDMVMKVLAKEVPTVVEAFKEYLADQAEN